MGLLGIHILILLEGLLTEYATVPQVSGMTYAFDSEAPAYGKLISDSVKVGGEPIGIFETYSIGVISLVPDLLDQAGISPLYVDSTGFTEYEALVEYAMEHSPVHYEAEGRIIDVSLSSVEEGGVLPSRGPALYISPNPVRAAGDLLFELRSRCEVGIRLFDVTGRRVASSNLGTLGMGTHAVPLSHLTRGLRSGVYILQLDDDVRVRTARFILSR
jgi:hypothetical protein